jgi:hypothetical protein
VAVYTFWDDAFDSGAIPSDGGCDRGNRRNRCGNQQAIILLAGRIRSGTARRQGKSQGNCKNYGLCFRHAPNLSFNLLSATYSQLQAGCINWHPPRKARIVQKKAVGKPSMGIGCAQFCTFYHNSLAHLLQRVLQKGATGKVFPCA